jgi:Ca-activated chloride channel family protein
MTFVYPARLLLLCLPVILGWWTVRRVGPSVKLPFDGVKARSAKYLQWTLRLFELIPAVLLGLAVIFSARPQVLRVPDRERVATHITICMDVSGSMGAGMGGMNRYESAAAAIEQFTLAREGDAIGLTLFGSWPLRWVPLTKDLQALRNALVFANPSNQPRGMGGTMIGSALEYCADNMEREAARLSGEDDANAFNPDWRSEFARRQLFSDSAGTGGIPMGGYASQNNRLLVLVSDGASGDLNGADAISQITDRLNGAGITMYHIHIGSDSIPNAVSTIAEETGGRAFLATNSDGLKLIFDHIDRMQPAKFLSTASVPIDYFEPFAWVGFVSLLVWLISLLKWRRTPW